MQPFRQWTSDIWFEHVDEVEAWGRRKPDYTSQDYFNKYKWWLRREYRHRLKEEKCNTKNDTTKTDRLRS